MSLHREGASAAPARASVAASSLAGRGGGRAGEDACASNHTGVWDRTMIHAYCFEHGLGPWNIKKYRSLTKKIELEVAGK